MCAGGGEPPTGGRVLVVGLGSPDRGDDGVGPRVAAAIAQEVAERGMVGVHVVEHEDPTVLVDLLEPARPTGAWDALVVIDAIRSGAAPGTLMLLEVGGDRQDLRSLGARLDPGPAGTHGFGLAGAIELARVLDRLPRRVTVVGVEAHGFEHGAPMSEPVHAAITTATAAALAIIGTELAPVPPMVGG
jgi:hydrogenase maturation protease